MEHASASFRERFFDKNSPMKLAPVREIELRPFERTLAWFSGSVRARASKYNLCSRTGGDVPSRGFQDGQHRHGAAEELESAAIGGNVLMMARARAEEVAEFVVCATEPSR